MLTTAPLKAIIIDDEPNAVAVLEILLATYCPNVLVVAATTKSPEGVKLVRQVLPDIVFLDIQMPHLNGFQVLDLLEDLDFGVIFTTAYDENALKAFKYSAIDFLLKPIDTDDLIQAVAKFTGKKPQVGQLLLFQQSFQTINLLPERLALPGLKNIAFQPVTEIIYCEANNAYTNFVNANGHSIMVAKPIEDYEAILCEGYFFRIHQRYIINTKRIQALLEYGAQVEMDNGTELPVAQNRKNELLEFLKV